MKKLRLMILGLSLIFSSCALFENDVADFMEKYTETAAIEQHSFNVETYNNASNQLCIASDADAEITLLMRNPKKFSLIPSVDFNNLASNYSRSAIAIDQEDSFTVKLSLPQEFLIPVDEGKDITALINLHEPMSGRDFDRYTVNLSCNTKPPAILNPTILNKSNQIFVIAFDMPNEEEVAIRHKDLASVEINGVSYPVQVTTETDSTSDPEHPDLQVARYTFTDPHFKRSYNSNYYAIGGKNFEHNANNSVYFESDDTFSNGDKEYTIILRDKAGLTSEVKASTSISKLKKPIILDQSGFEITEDGLTSAPFNEETELGTITIIPPTEDHHDQPVSGTTVYYRVYEATGSGRIYTSGTTTTTKTIELPQNTYRVEAYATLTNYENSATRTVKFRFLNNVIFVDSDNTDPEADGSESSPYQTIMEAIESINDVEMRPERRNKYTIYVKGTHGDLELNKLNIGGVMQDIRTDELVITRKPNSTYTSVINSISITGAVTLQKVTIGNITISNSNSSGVINGISHRSPVTALYIDGTTIENCNASGAYGLTAVNCAPVTITNANISNNATGISGEDCNLTINGGKIYHNESYGLCYGGGSTTCTMTGVEVYENGYNSADNQGIYLDAGNCTLTNCNIHNNYGSGISLTYSSICKLYGGSVKQNLNGGISLTTDGTNRLQIKGAPVVQQNTVPDSPDPTTRNVLLQAGQNIEVVGQLTSGCRIGVTTDSARTPSAVGDKFTFTSGYKAKNPTSSPSNFFTSDGGFSIALDGNEAGVAIAGGSGGMGNAFDYAMTFAFENEEGTALTRFNQNEVTPLYIRPTITKNGSPVTYASLKSSISWTIKLYNGGTFVQNLSVAENGTDRIKVNLPSSLVGSYIVEVSANLLSLSHPGSCTLNCVDPNASTEPIPLTNNIASLVTLIPNMTSNGTVSVEGSITAEDFANLKTALNELQNNHSGVLIELDFSDAIFTEIPENAFKNCANITSVKLPEGLETIGQGAFSVTDKLETIYLPSSLTSIGRLNFSASNSHTKFDVYYAGTLEQWLEIEMSSPPFTHTTANADTKLYVKSGGVNTLIEGEITIDGSKVSRIGNGAFYRNRKITKVTVTDGVLEIGIDSFSGTNITEITLPSNMNSIGEDAFRDCTELISITLPEGITELTRAFMDCSGLTSVYIPASLTRLEDAFRDCSNLASVTGSTTGWKEGSTSITLTAENLQLSRTYTKE